MGFSFRAQTDVTAECQILIFNNQHFESLVGTNSLAKGYPATR